MLRPSYSELIDVLNKDKDVDNKVASRYTIVIAAAKRARQLVGGDAPLVDTPSDKAVSVAVTEMAQSKVHIYVPKETEETKANADAPVHTEYLNHEDLGFQ